jgi:hypothetical protein
MKEEDCSIQETRNSQQILTIKIQMTRPYVIGSLGCEGIDWLRKAGGGSNEVQERTLVQ